MKIITDTFSLNMINFSNANISIKEIGLNEFFKIINSINKEELFISIKNVSTTKFIINRTNFNEIDVNQKNIEINESSIVYFMTLNKFKKFKFLILTISGV